MQLKSLAKQTVIYGLPSIVGRVLNFLLVPLYTHVFAPDQYGIVTELYAYVALLLVLLTYGMETTFFRFMQKYKGDRSVYSTSVWSLAATTAVFLSLVFGFHDRIGQSMGYPEAGQYISWFGIILAADVMVSVPFCLLREQNKALRFAVLKSLNIAVNIFLNLFFILYCPARLHANPDSWLHLIYNPDMGVGYIFISNLIASLFTFVCLAPEWKQLRFVFNARMWKEMMVYTLPIMVWGIAGIIDGTFDRILFKHLSPDPASAMGQLGIYGACSKLAIIMTLFVQAFRFAAEPFFFKQMNAADAKETYAKVMKYFAITCAFIYLACVLFLDQIMYFVGADYRQGSAVVPVLLMANLFLGVFFNLSVWYKVSDKTRIGMYISLIGAAITVGMDCLLIPVFGYHGAAWTLLTCYVALSVISYFWGQRYYPVPYPVKRILLYLAAAVLIGIPGLSIPFGSLWGKLAYGLAGLIVFGWLVVKKEPELPALGKGILNHAKGMLHKR
ncbi:MAG: oligosaccharide flippase family protein [Bacteroides sp.]|nr:oligosaccharide flippase family protein [Bacteroides sp.]MCM1531050.1 oligosaccharide flippase family protein [Ruminococcus flavefaciens]MCM1554957.1 oligosaccharide flippase family protein [Bacteroides sp.]